MESGKRDLSTVVIKRCSSRLSLDGLLSVIGKANEAQCVAQVFDPEMVINRTHLLGAYLNAINSFDSGNNAAKNVGMEMLLFAAMTRQISDAIKLVGAKSSKDFILFACDDKTMMRMKKCISRSEDAVFTGKHVEQLLRNYKVIVPKGGDAEQFLLQKMTMSALDR